MAELPRLLEYEPRPGDEAAGAISLAALRRRYGLVCISCGGGKVRRRTAGSLGCERVRRSFRISLLGSIGTLRFGRSPARLDWGSAARALA